MEKRAPIDGKYKLPPSLEGKKEGWAERGRKRVSKKGNYKSLLIRTSSR